jgi:23S rRNA G2445 N2-methylase RlmL
MQSRLLARTVRGIEDVVADEIRAIGGVGVELRHREVRFTGDPTSAVSLGTADDVFAVMYEGGPTGPHRSDLASLPAVDLDGATFDVTASFLGRRAYSRFDVEDALGRPFPGYRSRRHGDPGSTERAVRVHLTQEATTIAVRVAPAPLHRRAYRVVSRPGALHPPLARALVRLAQPRRSLLDPFCGTGTIPIEAKLADPALAVSGSDLDPAAARANVRAAGIDVAIRQRDAGSAREAVETVVTNPPWGISVRPRGRLDDWWRLVAGDGRAVILLPDGAVPRLPAIDRRPIRISGRTAVIWVCGRAVRVNRGGQPKT